MSTTENESKAAGSEAEQDDGSSSAFEPPETLVAGRQRRATAGNR